MDNYLQLLPKDLQSTIDIYAKENNPGNIFSKLISILKI